MATHLEESLLYLYFTSHQEESRHQLPASKSIFNSPDYDDEKNIIFYIEEMRRFVNKSVNELL